MPKYKVRGWMNGTVRLYEKEIEANDEEEAKDIARNICDFDFDIQDEELEVEEICE